MKRQLVSCPGLARPGKTVYFFLGSPEIQPRPQGLLAFQYGGGRREDPACTTW